MLANAGDFYPHLNYVFIADVYTLAGHPIKAWYYRLGTGAAAPSPSTASGSLVPAPADKSAMPATQTPAEKEKAKDLMNDLVTGTQEDIQSNLDRGVDLASAQKFTEARDAFIKALMLDPGYPLTLSNLCALDLQERKIAEAKEYCERALVRGPDFADAHYNLALVFLQLRDSKNVLNQITAAEKNGRDVTALRAALRMISTGR